MPTDTNNPQVKVPTIFGTLTNAAANKSWLSGATGAGAVLVVLGVLDPENSKAIIDGMQGVMDGIGVMVGGFKKIYLGLPAGALVWLAGSAGVGGTIFGALKKLGGTEAKAAGIAVVAPDVIAAQVPGSNVMAKSDATVVATPAAAQAAKADSPTAPVVSTTDVAANPQLVQ